MLKKNYYEIKMYLRRMKFRKCVALHLLTKLIDNPALDMSIFDQLVSPKKKKKFTL